MSNTDTLFTLDLDADEAPINSGLTPDELQVVEQAKADGYYVQTGRRLQPLLAFREWCQHTRRPCITISKGERQARIYIDGRPMATVPVQDAEAAAARAAGKA